MRSLGQQIKEAREKKTLTQGQVATLVGISTAMMSMLESDETSPSAATLAKLVDVLNLDADKALQAVGKSVGRSTDGPNEKKT